MSFFQVLDLQNMDDLGYIQTHFEPLHMDDISDEHDQEPIISSQKGEKIDNNKEFLQRYQEKFQSNEIYLTDLNSCSNQQENTSVLFTRYSFGYDQICSRCICASSIIRNLSFISGNDIEFIKNKTLIHLLSRLLLLRHDYDHSLSDKKSFSWFECLLNIRENTLVTLANIVGVLIFDQFDSNLINQLIDGLLHWSTCYSDEGQTYYLSTQRLSIEILTKLSVHDMNIDSILATPPFYRIISLFHILIDWLNVDDIPNSISNSYKNLTQSQINIQREFAIVLLHALIQCDSNIINRLKHIPYIILLLINFLEDYEIKTNELILHYGLDYILRLINTQQADEILFTTNDMLKRTATCLLSIMNCTDNIKIMKKYEDRILNLSISNVIDPNTGRILTDILHYCSLYNS